MLSDPTALSPAKSTPAAPGPRPNASSPGASWVSFWSRRDFLLLCLAGFAAIVVSKGGALLSGMSADDYFFAFNGAPDSITSSFIAQGRALDILLAAFVDATGATFTSVAWLAFWLASATIPVAIATSIVAIKRDEKNHFYHYVSVVFIATHPYLTSYFLFKMSILNTAVVYALLAWLLVMFFRRTKFRHDIACTMLLAVSCYISQIVLVLFVIAAGAWAAWRACALSEERRDWREACYPIGRVVLVTLAAAVVYLASSAAVRHVAHVQALAAYTPNFTGGLAGVVQSDLRLVYQMLFLGEPLDPLWLKLWVMVVLAVLIAGCAVRKPKRGIACALVLFVGLVATAAPMAASWGRLVPRAFSPGGLCLGLVFCMACEGIDWPAMRKVAMLLWVPIAAFCLIGSALFYQQVLLTTWDQRMAAAIYQRARSEAGSHPSLRVVARWPVHRKPLSLAGPDFNVSAFYLPWAYPGLFGLATGEDVAVTGGDRSLCKGMPSWPAPGSTRLLGSASVLVCIGNVVH